MLTFSSAVCAKVLLAKFCKGVKAESVPPGASICPEVGMEIFRLQRQAAEPDVEPTADDPTGAEFGIGSRFMSGGEGVGEEG